MDWLGLGLRWLHIMAAITLAGGAIFSCCVLLPGLSRLDATARQALQDSVRRRWSILIMVGVLVLTATGLVNYLRTTPLFAGEEFKDTRKLYNIVWGVKFLLALVVFFLASALAGRSAAFDKLRQNARTWLTLNVLLVAVIVGLSGVLRSTHTQPAPVETAAAKP